MRPIDKLIAELRSISPYTGEPGRDEPRKEDGSGNRKWPAQPESSFCKPNDTEKRDSGSETGIRTYMKCILASKAGHTSIGGYYIYNDLNSNILRTVYFSTLCPYIRSTDKVLKPSKGASQSVFLNLPVTASDLYERLRNHGVDPQYRTFVEVCRYLHNQWYKTKTQNLGGLYETSAKEARCFVKELSVSGKPTALPKVLDDIGLTKKHRGYTPSEQAIRREFVGDVSDCFEILPCDMAWGDKTVSKLQDMYSGFLERPELAHIKDSYNKLSFLNEDILEVRDRYGLSRKSKELGFHYKGYAESILNGEPWRLTPKGNRVYAYVRGFPPDFRIRGFFDYKNGIEHVCLVDLKSSHPTVLGKVLDDYLRKQREKGVCVDNALYELDQYRSLIHSGTMYEQIQGPEKRKESKLKFQKWLNGEGWHYKEIDGWFEGVFPELFCVIRGFKSSPSFTPIHEHLRKIEAKAIMRIVELCGTLGIPAVPIIDEIMVPESEGAKVANLLLNIVFNQTELKSVVSVDYYDENEEGFAMEEVLKYSGNKDVATVSEPPPYP